VADETDSAQDEPAAAGEATAGDPAAATGPAAADEAAQPDGLECPCGKRHQVPAAVTRELAAHGPDILLRGPEGAYRVPRVFAASHDVTATALKDAAAEYSFGTA
jgi:hypothetical protein